MFGTSSKEAVKEAEGQCLQGPGGGGVDGRHYAVDDKRVVLREHVSHLGVRAGHGCHLAGADRGDVELVAHLRFVGERERERERERALLVDWFGGLGWGYVQA